MGALAGRFVHEVTQDWWQGVPVYATHRGGVVFPPATWVLLGPLFAWTALDVARWLWPPWRSLDWWRSAPRPRRRSGTRGRWRVFARGWRHFRCPRWPRPEHRLIDHRGAATRRLGRPLSGPARSYRARSKIPAAARSRRNGDEKRHQKRQRDIGLRQRRGECVRPFSRSSGTPILTLVAAYVHPADLAADPRLWGDAK